MPYSKPFKRGVEVVATRQCQHGDITAEKGYVGTAVKQVGYTLATARSAVATIAVGEQFFLATKGEVECPYIAGAVLGDPVSITTATGALTNTTPGGGQIKVGRVSALPGTFGEPLTPTTTGVTPVIPTGGLMRVDLDTKDSF